MKSPKNQIMATLEEFAAAYCAKDIDRLMAVFIDGDDISLIGTGVDELRSGRAAVADVFLRNFGDATVRQFEWGWVDVVVHDAMATVALSVRVHLDFKGELVLLPVRWTVALVKVANDWKWVHRHASSAAKSQKQDSAYPIDF